MSRACLPLGPGWRWTSWTLPRSSSLSPGSWSCRTRPSSSTWPRRLWTNTRRWPGETFNDPGDLPVRINYDYASILNLNWNEMWINSEFWHEYILSSQWWGWINPQHSYFYLHFLYEQNKTVFLWSRNNIVEMQIHLICVTYGRLLNVKRRRCTSHLLSNGVNK